MDLFYNDGNVLFMHLPIFKAESWGHRSAFNEKLHVFISVYVHVLYCIMYVRCVRMYVLYVCANVRMNVYVCLWIKSKTLPILSGQPKESAAKRDVFLCLSLCRRCVSSHLMLFNVLETDTTVHTPC